MVGITFVTVDQPVMVQISRLCRSLMCYIRVEFHHKRDNVNSACSVVTSFDSCRFGESSCVSFSTSCRISLDIS